MANRPYKLLLIVTALVLLAFPFLADPGDQAFAGPVLAPMDWVKDSANPVLASGPAGRWDELVGSAHVLKQGDQYRMWFGGTARDRSRDGIGYATSEDGQQWTRADENPLLSGEGVGYWDQYVGWPDVVYHDGLYRMWYRGDQWISPSGPIVLSLGYAESVDGVTWSPDPGSPVLGPSAAGQWDDTYISSGTTIRETSGYRMWYTGCSETRCQVGVATSVDGLTWVRSTPSPVVAVGPTGAWDSRYVFNPIVLLDSGVYHLWYSGSSTLTPTSYSIGHATSADGLTWTKDPANPLLAPTPNAWDSRAVLAGTVLAEGGGYTLWYVGVDVDWNYQVGRARQGPAMTTVTPSPSATHTEIPATPTATPTASATRTATGTPSPTWTVTASVTVNPTSTVTPYSTPLSLDRYWLYLPDIRLVDE
mgnify:CR=1 FL=1